MQIGELVREGVISIKTGPFGTQLKAAEYQKSGTPVLNVKNLGYGSVSKAKLDHVGSETVDRLRTHLLKKGDIVFGRKGAVDRHAYIDYESDGWMQGSDCIRMRIESNTINPRFLSYYFLTNRHKAFMISMCSHGTTMASLNQKILEQIEIPYPDRQYQDRVVDTLERIDKKIKVNSEINENLQQQAFTMFDCLLSQSDGDLCVLSDIAELNPKRQLAKGTVARCIDMAQLSTTGTFPSGWEMKPYNGGMRFTNGDTIIARITPCLENGKTAFIDFLDDAEVAFGSTEYIVLASKGVYPAEYFYCLARYPSFVDYAVKNMNGSSGRQRVSADTLGKYQLPKLTKDEITAFAEAVVTMFQVIRNNSLENLRLVALRDALLPRLMSGEIDVSAIQI